MFWLAFAAVRRRNRKPRAFAAAGAAAHRRDRHSAVRKESAKAAPARSAGRRRRGSAAALNSLWRRCEMGTNAIACFGVWRKGSRRTAPRLNRKGDTRWHRPKRAAGRPGTFFERSRR